MITSKKALDKYEIEVFNSKMHSISADESLIYILENIKNKKKVSHSVVNVAKLVKMQQDDFLRNSVNSCDIINIDGMGVVLGLRLLGFKIPERVTGIDLMEKILCSASTLGIRVFILGAKSDVLIKAVQNIRNKHKNINIVGFQDGYYKEENVNNIVNKINKLKPDILFVAMSTPKKEIFIESNKNKLNTLFIMGVGGSVDIYAGLTSRAPIWMQKIGLEWLYRIYQEPRRMWKRYLVTNTKFVIMIIKYKLNSIFKFRKKGSNCS